MKPAVKVRPPPCFQPAFPLLILIGCLLGGVSLAAQDASPAPSAVPPPVHLGKVQVDAQKRRVSFPAMFNMTEGMLEYVLVGSQGKTHESLLRTEVEPAQLHAAMLLLGVKTGERHPGDPPPSAIDADYLRTAPALKGDPITILLRWDADGKTTMCRAEECIYNLETKAAATPGDWTYNGSMFDENQFLAQQEKSFVALVTDPAALANNPRPGHDNDQVWSVAKEKVPAKDTPVEVILEIKPATAAAATATP